MAPSFLFLHAENLITLLNTLCPNLVQIAPGLCLTHNLDMLTPSAGLIELSDKVAPFELEMVHAVHALVKAAASKTRHWTRK
jgi:hypothetical protein